ncbi:MAG: hypothetical protein K6G54_07195 [Oscillospiraceae bacterium]|nr:hypothetical protein [Oscillospiraceae bacterium]
MACSIRMGVPEMAELWNGLREKNRNGTAGKDEQATYRKLGKALRLIAENPRHPGLQTHEITALTRRYGGVKVWQSYLENHTPQAGRIFWVYGPGQNEITVIGVEPHPNDKGNACRKITLSDMERAKE